MSTKRDGRSGGSELQRTNHPGVYRKGNSYVAIYRREGRQYKESASTFEAARAIKLERDAQAREQRRGETLHAYVLSWASGHSGSGHDTVKEHTREEYRRLLATYALRYFDRDLRLQDIDRRALQGFISWLTHCPGRKGYLSDRSIRNALTPLRLALKAAAEEGQLNPESLRALVLPKRRGGRRWDFSERRFLTRSQLRRLLDEIPPKHAPLFLLLATTGLRISEAIALRWTDLDLAKPSPHLRVRRAIVNKVVGAPKSRHGARSVPLPKNLASQLQELRPTDASEEALVFKNSAGGVLNPNNLRHRVLVPAAERAELPGVGLHTFRHTCAALLIAEGSSMLRLQRWMGHHSAAYTLEAYGHLIDGDIGGTLEL